MKLLAGGCSLIYGSELSDCKDSYSKLTYPALTAEYLGLEYDCVANPGNGNDAICRRVIEAVDQDVGFVVVNWSYHGRFEFHHDSHGWQSLRYTDEQFKDKFADLSKAFYAHLTETHSWYSYLQSIIVLQNFLLDKNIPFIFSSADNEFFKTSNPISMVDCCKKLYNLIDFDRWNYWTDRDGNKTGFVTWCKIHGYPVGTYRHPLTYGHYKTFNLIKDKAKELLS